MEKWFLYWHTPLEENFWYFFVCTQLHPARKKFRKYEVLQNPRDKHLSTYCQDFSKMKKKTQPMKIPRPTGDKAMTYDRATEQ